MAAGCRENPMFNQFLAVVKSLNSHKVRYVVIGGNAVALHGVPRNTFDLDIMIEPTEANAGRLLAALRDVGFGTADLVTTLRVSQAQITTFNDWVPLDVMTRVPGLSFATVWKNRMVRKSGGVRVPFLGRRDLIRSKRAAGRPQDLEDVRQLLQR
jgi:predicted nucleotidyltransferase